MATTTNYGLPYPALSDPPNGAAQIEDLATGTDTALDNIGSKQSSIDSRLNTVEERQIVYYDTPTATGPGADGSFTGSTSTVYTIASIDIADPGWSYRIAGRAGMRLTNLQSLAAYVSHSGSLMVGTQVPQDVSTATTGDTISAGFLSIQGPSDSLGTFGFLHLLHRRAANVYTGSQTVHFLWNMGTQGTAEWGPLNDEADYFFELEVIPA